MKVVEQPTRGTEMIGVGETRAFSLAADGQMFKNFISSIYSDAEKTVVRELMANALDAHAAIGSIEPIDVFLPTSFDPTFIVRDYGVGMSHDFVMDLYTIMGHSTKKDDNGQTGMFGVGSKSPLSICDTFTVRCFDKPGWDDTHPMNDTGRIRLYTISIANDGIPTLSHTFDVMPRDGDNVERGGTEIRVPINAYDRNKIIDGLVAQEFSWFDKKINFAGAYEEIEPRRYLGILPIAQNMYIGNPPKNAYAAIKEWNVYARQGAAVYEIKEEQVRYKLAPDVITALRALCKHQRHVMFDLPIGTVDVTTARENIKYNSTSVSNLVDAIVASVKDFEEKLSDIIGDEMTMVGALKILAAEFIAEPEERTKFQNLKIIASLLPLVQKRVKENYDVWYKDAPLIDTLVPDVDDATGMYKFDDEGNRLMVMKPVEQPYNPPTTKPKFRAKEFSDGKVFLTHNYIGSDGESCYISFQDNATDISVEFPNVFYVLPSHLPKWKERVHKHIKQTFNAEEFPHPSREGLSVYIIRVAKRHIDSAVQKIAGARMALFTHEDLPEIEYTQNAPRVTSKNQVHEFVSSSWSKGKVEPDFDEPAYYLTRVGTQSDCIADYQTLPAIGSYTMRKRMSDYDISRAVNNARRLGILDSDTPIYRVTEKQEARIKRLAPTWSPLASSIASQLIPLIGDTDTLTILESPLAKGNSYHTRTFITEALRVDDYPERRRMFDNLYAICNADPVYCAHAAVYYVVQNSEDFPGLLPHVERVSAIQQLSGVLFDTALMENEALKTEMQQVYDLWSKRYTYFENHVSSRHEDAIQKHAGYYLQGFIADNQATFALTADMIKNSAVKDIMDTFKKKLDALHAELYPCPQVTLGATANV